MSMDKLIEKIVEKQNPTVAGLDPKLSYIPEHIRSASYEKYGKTLEGAADALLASSTRGSSTRCVTWSPRSSPRPPTMRCTAGRGCRPWRDHRLCQGKGMFVITDGKRNDIGATMTAYAAAHLGQRWR